MSGQLIQITEDDAARILEALDSAAAWIEIDGDDDYQRVEDARRFLRMRIYGAEETPWVTRPRKPQPAPDPAPSFEQVQAWRETMRRASSVNTFKDPRS